ncbi:hypothetical protein NOF55_12070 [Rhizobiaceae bacterium BDR2-2]|uniref:SnoaL-like domain-containing protein n=1 Tax=Ectorhizobium quercum TaxID=2965071 RepID=A0AAE3SVM8_9HYPH|nr:hypothetical protein [Ectorhizobium quercum]MCX8997838.1 hypothetical protein [Ectorhizobium quercum]
MRLAFTFFVAGFVSFAVPASAQSPDPVAPVKEVMDITISNWSEDVDEWKSIFESELLDRLYARDLVALYRQASEKAAKLFDSDDPVDPFDYDVVTGSPDGCPLQDVKIALAGEKDGVSDVVATFRLWTCEENEDTRNLVTEAHFEVVQEDGRAVIRDIYHILDGERDSVVEELRTMIAQEDDE